MTLQEHQARGCANYSEVTSRFMVEQALTATGARFDAPDGHCVVVERETRDILAPCEQRRSPAHFEADGIAAC